MIADNTTLSLSELEAHDPRHSGRGTEQRFLCPLPACADHQGRDHKNLAANIETGLWRCCRCEASGKLTEKWEPRERLSPRARARRAFGLSSSPGPPSPTIESQAAPTAIPPTPMWRKRWDQAVLIAGTPGADYLRSRGIPEAIATAAGVRYLEKWGHWQKDATGTWQLEGTSRRVLFPVVDQLGELVGIQGRKIAADEPGEKVLTNGSAGVFWTTWTPEKSGRLGIVEAPIDALSLAAAGMQALATQGTAWPDWLPRGLAFKTVLLAHDADDAGDAAAAKMTPELRAYGATVDRWRPDGAKDVNEILLQHGLDVVRLAIADDDQVADDVEDLPAPVQGVPIPPAAPYALVERPDQVDVDELLTWLAAAPRPAAPFQLWPWARAVDVDRFYAALEADLGRGPKGQRWLPAVEDLRQLTRLFASAG